MKKLLTYNIFENITMANELVFYTRYIDLKQIRSLLEQGSDPNAIDASYGNRTRRLTVPLAERGCLMTGADLSPRMVAAARRNARAAHQRVRFVTVSMLALPFAECTFEKVLCLWSSFVHLLARAEQVRALAEMVRVLVKGGLAVVEVNNGEAIALQRLLRREGAGPDRRVARHAGWRADEPRLYPRPRFLEEAGEGMPVCVEAVSSSATSAAAGD